MRDRVLDELLTEKGSAQRLAVALGITVQAIGQWERIPVPRVLDIERLTGIPRQKLRPDVYPPEREPVVAAE